MRSRTHHVGREVSECCLAVFSITVRNNWCQIEEQLVSDRFSTVSSNAQPSSPAKVSRAGHRAFLDSIEGRSALDHSGANDRRFVATCCEPNTALLAVEPFRSRLTSFFGNS